MIRNRGVWKLNQIIVYISYDQFEYVNYYHLIYNSDILLEYCPEEKVDDLFQKIDDIKSELNNSEIYIVQDENAFEWNCYELFREHNLELRLSNDNDISQICEIMKLVFQREFMPEKLNILFYGNVVIKDECCETDETLRQAEEILKHGGEEMTELARIIKEKYERMNIYD